MQTMLFCAKETTLLNPALEMKWNESGFRPPLCTYRLNWARTTSWGWWDDWDDTVFQTQDSKFEPWRSEAVHATHNTDFHTWMGKKHFCFLQIAETGNRTPNSGGKGSGANHYPRPSAQNPAVETPAVLTANTSSSKFAHFSSKQLLL